MSDIDFDELDRAVNSVIGDSTNDVTPVDIPQPAPVDATVAAPAPVETRQAPAARRAASGRFMDMVHPSSDMRNGTAPTSASLTRSAPAVVATPSPVTQTPQPQEAPTVVSAPEPATPQSNDLVGENWSQPLESPFITDAKVEKRPLGGEAPTAAEFDALELLAMPDEPLLEAPDEPRIEAHTMPDPLDFGADLDETLDTTNDSQTTTATEVVSEGAELEETLDAYGAGTFDTVPTETVVEEVAPAVVAAPAEPPVAENPEVPAGPASISQQYEERPSEAPDSGAIYDTESYHKPLTPVAKKKSGILVVVWIFLLVLLGAGVGAAVYFFVIPML